MTIIEETDSMQAATDPTPDEFTQYQEPRLPEVGAPIGLTGFQVDSELPLCGPHMERYSNCPLPRTWLDPCDPAYDPDAVEPKCSKHEFNQKLFRPFEIYDLNEEPCVDPTVDPQALSNQIVSENSAWALTSALDHGLSVTTTTLRNANPDARDDLTPGVDVTTDAQGVVTVTDPGVAVDPAVALTAISRAMSKRGLGVYSILVPHWSLTMLKPYVETRGGIRRAEGDVPVLSGLGLTGVGPDATGNIDLADEGQVYFYAIRKTPRYLFGEIDSYAPGGTMRHERTNHSMAEGLRKGMVVFDPGCVYSIRVCLNKGSNCD